MVQLCTRYAKFNPHIEPLGYGGLGTLITFAHGMPNNAPAIFHQRSTRKSRPWAPLYPQRVTSGRRGEGQSRVIDEQSDGMQVDLQRITKQRVLLSPKVRSAPLVLREAVGVLLSLDRGPRSVTAISARTGLSVERVKSAFARIDTYGWMDDDCRVTEKGRRELARLGGPIQRGVQFGPSNLYIPRSLRTPRAV